MADSSENRAKRQRIDKKGRFAALERLRSLKGSKNKCDVEEEVDDVYEVVDESEYAKRAQEKYGGDWIEDDGTGYAEDGRDFFEDEGDFGEEVAGKSSKKSGTKKRLRDNGNKPAKGKANLVNLFAKLPKNTATKKSIKDDDVLANILSELDSGTATASNTLRMPSKSTAAVAKEYMSNFINSAEKQNASNQIASDDAMLERILKEKAKNEKRITAIKAPAPIEHNTTKAVDNVAAEADDAQDLADFSGDDTDFHSLPDEQPQSAKIEVRTPTPQSAPIKKISAKATGTHADDMSNLLSNWESICQLDNDFEQEVLAGTNAVNKDAVLDGNEDELRFWYWEAWEDAQRRPGVVFLFGRTADGKSVCVRVEDIERVLYLLPREYMLDNITKEATKQKVTVADIYKEFDEEIANEINLASFRSRKVSKSFAYHPIGIDVPQVCDYMEVRYDGKKPPPKFRKKLNSIAHIFGAQTTSLECFLLERKIKGPCWLSVRNFRSNPASISWCKTDITVISPKGITPVEDGRPAAPPPPISLLTLNVRTALNPKTLKNEICMISMLSHNRFHIDKPAPQPAFNRHVCGITRPAGVYWPLDLPTKLATYKSTRIHKHDSERALLSWFLAQYQQIDPDLIVTYDALDCQLNVIGDRIVSTKIAQWSRLGRLRLSQVHSKKLFDFFIGRMVCDVKRSAEECIRSRSYDLQTLCQNVLKLKEHERVDINSDELHELYGSGDGLLKLITLTMQDASFMLRLMCELNIMPLALQITNICGNTMTRTLQGGRSERNEFLLLHAFTEKNYIVPDRKKPHWLDSFLGEDEVVTAAATTGRKKAAYAGGLVLDPIRGLYDKYVLLLDFNSLYPSIIQEYNICFTTVQAPYNSEDLPDLPDESAKPGILPQQLRRLVESRREVKKLLATPDLAPELQMQYHIRQMALKLTANSMYGCLGFAHSRFFAQHLAALVTFKGREILTNTKSLVQKMNYEVVYGDTDSIMVNTNITDYDQVFKIGHAIKQSVNKLYKQLELDIDGVFSVLLLLKKKKYAAVKVTKMTNGELRKEQEHKGLDIVRRDWSQLAVMVGKVVLDEVLSDKPLDEKLEAVHAHLERIKTQVLENAVPLPMYLITKQLTKPPLEYSTTASQPHVQVALRMNKEHNRRYKKGDMVDYVICEDGTKDPAMQRAYHIDELKTNEQLKLDQNYYLAHQIHPVVTRMVDVLEGTDASRIAECLGLDPNKYKAAVQRTHEERAEDASGESLIKTTLQKYRFCEKFTFVCIGCSAENLVASAFKPANVNGKHEPVLLKCANVECTTAPYQYLVAIRNQLLLSIRKYITRFYRNWLVCDNPACNQNTRAYTHATQNMRPLCMTCKNGALVRQYSERDLYTQLCYFQYIFDLSKHQQKINQLIPELEQAYNILRETVDQQLEKSAYCIISLEKLFKQFKPLAMSDEISHKRIELPSEQIAVNLPD